jgi:hypothetical protein
MELGSCSAVPAGQGRSHRPRPSPLIPEIAHLRSSWGLLGSYGFLRVLTGPYGDSDI